MRIALEVYIMGPANSVESRGQSAVCCAWYGWGCVGAKALAVESKGAKAQSPGRLPVSSSGPELWQLTVACYLQHLLQRVVIELWWLLAIRERERFVEGLRWKDFMLGGPGSTLTQSVLDCRDQTTD